MQANDSFGSMPEHLGKRQQEIFAALMQIAEQEDIDPSEIFQKSLCFFDAPVGVYFVTYKRNDHQYRLSTAAALENFLLAAHAKGLGTCWLTVTVICEEDIKKHLGILEDKELLGGVALGYPAKDSLLNSFQRTRVPVDEVTRWLGF
jgi:nitroreductase